MAAVTAGSWTITPLPTRSATHLGSVHPGYIEGKRRRVNCRLSLSATQALTYPSSGGMVLPSWRATVGSGDTSYGMVQHLDYVIMYGPETTPSAGGVLWKYVASERSIRGFWGLYPTAAGGATHFTELPTTWNPSDTNAAGLNFYIEAVGW